MLPGRTGIRRIAFTLVEVLLATALGGSVITVSTVVAVQSVAVQRLVESELVRRWERIRVLERFEADVESELTWLPDSIDTITLSDKPGRLVEVLTLVGTSDAETPLPRRLPARVAYVLQESPVEPGTKRLWREVRLLTDADPEVTREVLADRLLEVCVERYDGEGWTTTRRNVGTAGGPQALRLTCRWSLEPGRLIARTVMVRDRAHGPRGGRG